MDIAFFLLVSFKSIFLLELGSVDAYLLSSYKVLSFINTLTINIGRSPDFSGLLLFFVFNPDKDFRVWTNSVISSEFKQEILEWFLKFRFLFLLVNTQNLSLIPPVNHDPRWP